ncbi:MAG TPA: hypothetical protein VF519_12595 [Mycobacteriales bacterium]|jgi:hypothetical protein
MRRTLALAALAVAAAAPLLATPASACDPYRPPWCQNACTIGQSAYTSVRNAAGVGPYWYNLDLGVCGT